jgi:hypothetical protein
MAAFDALAHDPEKLQTFRTKIMRESKNVESAKRFDLKAWRSEDAADQQGGTAAPGRFDEP